MRLGPTGLIEVVSPYDAVTQAQLRAIRPAGTWHTRRHCWQFPLEAAAILEHQLAGRIPPTAELHEWLAWVRQPRGTRHGHSLPQGLRLKIEGFAQRPSGPAPHVHDRTLPRRL
jgi:hypothetical protein